MTTTSTAVPSPAALAEQPRVLGSMLRVPIDQVHQHPDNVRDSLGDLTELAASIRAHGILQALVVEKAPDGDGFRVLAGNRRRAAAELAGLRYVDVVLRRDMDDAERLTMMLVENCQRRDLNPIEQARAMQRLQVDSGYDQFTIAREVGKSVAWVSTRLAMLRLPEDQQAAIANRVMSIADANEAVKVRPGMDRGWEPPHLTTKHRLAAPAGARCDAAGHNQRRRIGGVACGRCWEDQIRSDERAVAARTTATTPGEG